MKLFGKEKPSIPNLTVAGQIVEKGKKYKFGYRKGERGIGVVEQDYFTQGRVKKITEWRSRFNPSEPRHNIALRILGFKTNLPWRERNLDTREISTVKEIQK